MATKLYFGNLSPDITLDMLKNLLLEYDVPIVPDTVQLKNHFAFVEVQDNASAEETIRKLHGGCSGEGAPGPARVRNLNRPFPAPPPGVSEGRLRLQTYLDTQRSVRELFESKMAAGGPDAALAVPGPVVPCPPVLLAGPRPPFPMFHPPSFHPNFPVQFSQQAGFPCHGFPGYNFHGSVITVEHSVQRNRGS
ncbi:Hypp5696 [Branchiostoma lanceolatum]|uniref:Hypp5696 protein n=1 Tax=Branchiostoma lanceolatum TaxID=7740 RepID=A0A8J9W780_BRALA|nr:Hypp5696 [Branchiostoma lanceolatum]